ncbi:prepilin peptidase [Lysinibacillus sp. 2017]|uniref:prepilin peptidase n=1 Tax=unclassified Lysinibacillus TaxID=2636778 RepID=UPI000D527816|nr:MULTISPECIES: A24 family peptidase [unclassified Lysinibacillus]AWE06089.1 prepilin peptidase [Lysinibacillus sp. 2017]TGN33366.1 prepilin peptidase [Lysinibacillus sp. S2017]
MDSVIVVFAGIIGLILGSFYNVVGLRIPQRQSLITPPSHCINCNRRLTSLDLIPVISYIMLRGKCRICGVKISIAYPFIELVTAFLFAFATWKVGYSWELLVALLFISLLVIINVSDMAYMLIPNRILLFFFPLLVIGRILSPLTPWWDSVLGAIIGFSLLLVIGIISKGGMGGGDIKLFLLIGFVLGTVHTVVTLFFASVIGMIVGGILLVICKRGRKAPMPFGPSIAIAAILVYFYGDSLMDAYKSLFL